MTTNRKDKQQTPAMLSRRHLLARVGLIAGAAYVAPAMAGFNAARASTGSGASGGSSGASNSSGPSNSGSSNSGSSNSGPSNSGPSNSGPSRNQRRTNGNNSADLPPWMKRVLGV